MARLTTVSKGSNVSGEWDLDPLPDIIIDYMLEAEAKVVVRAQQAKGEALGVWDTGKTVKSIKLGKKYKRKNGDHQAIVAPMGERTRGERNASRTRNAEIAFLNEYGVPGRNIEPKQFIRIANEECADEAVAAAEKVYHAYLNKKGL